MLKSSDLAVKDVINVNDGRKLGSVSDIEFDIDAGKLTAIVVPGGSSRFMGLFNRGDDVVIPWERIHKIGKDVILVNLMGTAELEN